MSHSRPGFLSRLWFKWKSLQLPWRKRRLVGMDLSGTTFWEFKDHLNANRLRRIAQQDRRTHYADIQLSPQWIQWLRHTREHPPSIQEQQQDVQRQIQLKQLARLADERWAAQPSAMDAPERTAQAGPAMLPNDPGGYTAAERNAAVETSETYASVDEGPAKREEPSKAGDKKEAKESPWKVRQGAPSETWQPQAWKPSAARGRQ